MRRGKEAICPYVKIVLGWVKLQEFYTRAKKTQPEGWVVNLKTFLF